MFGITNRADWKIHHLLRGDTSSPKTPKKKTTGIVDVVTTSSQQPGYHFSGCHLPNNIPKTPPNPNFQPIKKGGAATRELPL